MSDADIKSVKAYKELVRSLLAKAAQVKPAGQVEPPLTEVNLSDTIWRARGKDEVGLKEQAQQAHYAAVETAFREKFYELLVSFMCISLELSTDLF
jgi:THO complex subunit 1